MVVSSCGALIAKRGTLLPDRVDVTSLSRQLDPPVEARA